MTCRCARLRTYAYTRLRSIAPSLSTVLRQSGNILLKASLTCVGASVPGCYDNGFPPHPTPGRRS